MTINWPLTPNVGDTIEGPRGEVWKWDGQKWVSVVSGGGGGGGVPTDVTGTGTTFVLQQGPTINQPRVMGVTDGSSTAPGEVGEYVFYREAVGVIPQGANHSVGVGLTAGDWDVSFSVSLYLASNQNNLSIQILTDSTPLNGMYDDTPVGPWSGRWTLPPRRVSSATGAYVYMLLDTWTSNGPATVNVAEIAARRVR